MHRWVCHFSVIPAPEPSKLDLGLLSDFAVSLGAPPVIKLKFAELCAINSQDKVIRFVVSLGVHL